MAVTFLTKSGVEKLRQQLEEFKAKKRRLSEEVGSAREYGDLRENAEYHVAKERLQQILQKISDLEFKLSHVHVVDPQELIDGVATLGTQVTVKDLSSNDEEKYLLVGSEESDPASGRISVQSPLGKAFVGRKVKEKVEVSLPIGVRSYQILSIQPIE